MTKPASHRSNVGKFITFVFALSIIALLILGWTERDEYWFTAESGWGYTFGIVGGSLMLLLLLYPLRKRWKLMRSWFSIRYWFQLHMLFGILGPVLILFHSNFHLGSLNSSIAFFCMLLVASSGLVGRYVYRKIHRGLYGELLKFEDFNEEYQQSRKLFLENQLVDTNTLSKLEKVEKLLTARTISLWDSWFANHTVAGLQRKIKRQIRKNLKKNTFSQTQGQELKIAYQNWQQGIQKLKKMANLAFNTQLFSLWHIFHLPFFFMMIITAVVHVVVVHMY
ncbi:MAG TPA: transcriptional regulator [Aeromonadales bacterium]|nr:transcriptional regulator [Aeromonadales bacterium]